MIRYIVQPFFQYFPMSFRLIPAIILLFVLSPAAYADVLVTIRPLQLLVSELLPASEGVHVLLDESDSPHDFSLSVHDVARLKAADLVFWVGPGFETHLRPALNKYVAQDRAYAFSDFIGDGHIDSHDHDHEQNDNEHIWVSFENAERLSVRLAEQLRLHFPSLDQQILNNLDRFLHELESEKQRTESWFKSKGAGYFAVYHDGYRPFVEEFGLDQRAYIVRDEHANVSVSHLLALRREMAGGACLIADVSELEQAEGIARKLDLALVESDLLGQRLAQSDGYIEYIRAMGSVFRRCLAAK
jgi:zinc transport system substrate-binding protein